METEYRNFPDLVAFFRSSRVQMDHWFHDEGGLVHAFASDEEALSLASFRETDDWESWKSTAGAEVDRAFFVDGRMRIHARILFEEHVLLLGEVVAGYATWERGKGVFPGFSPQRRPLLRRVIGVPEELLRGTIVERQELDLGEGFVFQVETSERASRYPQGIEASRQALFNALARLERDVTLGLLEQGFPVVKDGILHGGDAVFTFRPGVGPVGLVKRIERLPLSSREREVLFGLGRGERTPFLSLEVSEGLFKVFSYIRLTERLEHFPWKGLVRVEVLVREEVFPSVSQEIGAFFDRMAGFLPHLTADFPWRRLPENIFPIIALENALGQFFAASSHIQYRYEKTVRRFNHGDHDWDGDRS